MLKFNHKLLYAEETLVLVKKALRHTPLWTSLKLKHSEDYNPSTMLASLALKIEGLPGYNNFLDKFWAKTRGFQGSSTYVSIADAPAYFLLHTENRLALYNYVHHMARALHGKSVSLSHIAVIWRWDITRKRSNGLPRHYQSYEFDININMGNAVSFDADAWLGSALTAICPSTDTRADEYPFETIERALGFNKCRSMEKTHSGLVLRFDDRADAELCVGAVYSDCAPNYTSTPEGTYVTLVYPDMQEILEAIET